MSRRLEGSAVEERSMVGCSVEAGLRRIFLQDPGLEFCGSESHLHSVRIKGIFLTHLAPRIDRQPTNVAAAKSHQLYPRGMHLISMDRFRTLTNNLVRPNLHGGLVN